MNQKINNIVIESVEQGDGLKIIKYFQNLGFDTTFYEGNAFSKSVSYNKSYGCYYGVVDNKFTCLSKSELDSLHKVKLMNLPDIKNKFTHGDGVVATPEIIKELAILADKCGYKVYDIGGIKKTIEPSWKALYWKVKDSDILWVPQFVECDPSYIKNKITPEDFELLLNNTININNLKNEPMKEKTYFLPAEPLREGYSAANGDQAIFLEKNVNWYTGEISESNLKRLYDMVCTEWQKRLSVKFPHLIDKNVYINIDSKVINSVDGNNLIERRSETTSSLKDVSFWLNESYDWKFAKDNHNQLCLVPTKK